MRKAVERLPMRAGPKQLKSRSMRPRLRSGMHHGSPTSLAPRARTRAAIAGALGGGPPQVRPVGLAVPPERSARSHGRSLKAFRGNDLLHGYGVVRIGIRLALDLLGAAPSARRSRGAQAELAPRPRDAGQPARPGSAVAPPRVTCPRRTFAQPRRGSRDLARAPAVVLQRAQLWHWSSAMPSFSHAMCQCSSVGDRDSSDRSVQDDRENAPTLVSAHSRRAAEAVVSPSSGRVIRYGAITPAPPAIASGRTRASELRTRHDRLGRGAGESSDDERTPAPPGRAKVRGLDRVAAAGVPGSSRGAPHQRRLLPWGCS